MVELNILVVAGKIRTSVVFAARPWITLSLPDYVSIFQLQTRQKHQSHEVGK
jgi:hypothetical protein